jgi:uncharacterized membrane protein YfcA
MIFELDGFTLTTSILAVFVMGVLIGSVGVGGLLLAPWLVRVTGIAVHEAIALSMAAFIATGVVAVILFWRGEAGVGERWPAIAATVPGACLGALALWAIPGWIAAAMLALFLVATGIRMLKGGSGPVLRKGRAGGAADGLTGLVTGFFSALTGTGGPMVMVPLLVWRGTPLLAAIALGQVVQLPVSLVATLTNMSAGDVDLILAGVLAVPLVPGVLAGRRLARVMPLGALARLVALLLIGAGLWFGMSQI